jgi:hypothetical protein
MSTTSLQEVINLLKLEPLPQEGGFFRQTYKSAETIATPALPRRYQQAMSFGTAIYAALTAVDFSAMHRLDTDEIYHFYLGDPLEMLLLHPNGSGEIAILGPDLKAGMLPQKVVPREVWQGSRPLPRGEYGFSLFGTTMAPGFEWAGFELAEGDALIRHYPDFAEMIKVRVR